MGPGDADPKGSEKTGCQRRNRTRPLRLPADNTDDGFAVFLICRSAFPIRSGEGRLDRRNQSIAPPRQSLQKSWVLRRVAQHPRILFIAVFRLRSTSTNVSGQRRFCNSSRVTATPGRSSRITRNWNGCPLNQFHAILAQLARPHICFKCAEAHKLRTGLRSSQWGKSLSARGPCGSIRACKLPIEVRELLAVMRINIFHISLTRMLPPIH